MITYEREDPPDNIIISGGTLQVPAWGTRTPGLLVIPFTPCARHRECFRVYSTVLDQTLPVCFAIKLCAAVFASFLEDLPWTSETPALLAAFAEADWEHCWDAARQFGGVLAPYCEMETAHA